MAWKRLAIRLFFFLCAIGLTASLNLAVSKAADEIPRMTIQELKAKMDSGEKIVILDVRTGEDYKRSKVKIAGAVRIPVDQLESRYKELPAGMEIVAYCA